MPLTVGSFRTLLEERALAHDAMDASRVHRIREDMERAEARRLQPHYIESFFLEAFQRLGGTAKQREPRRYEVTHVPAPVRNRDRLIGIGEPVLPRYERIAFEKPLVAPQGLPLAAFVCPAIRCSTPPSILPWSAIAICCAGARFWWTSAIRAPSLACSSIWNMPFRMPALPARARGASFPSACCTWNFLALSLGPPASRRPNRRPGIPVDICRISIDLGCFSP